MKNCPAVSVVIPTYNHALFLRNAIQSVCDQSFDDWEMIIVNNYSNDDTESVINSFNDTRIRHELFKNNGVIASSRNYGIELSRGEFIAFLDSDDIWYGDKLERSVSALKQGYDLICHAENWMRAGSVVRTVQYGPTEMAIYRTLLYSRNCLSTSAITVRKRCLKEVGGFSEDAAFITAEDYDLWLRLSRSGVTFHFLEDVLGEYTLHDSNSSNMILRQMRAELSVLKKHFDEIDHPFFTDRLRYLRRVSRTYLAYGSRRFRAP